MSPAGPFSMLCIPVMAPLSAADELMDNLSSEPSMRQRFSMGNRPHARIWWHGGRRVTEKGATAIALIGLTLVPLGQMHIASGVVGSMLGLFAVVAGSRFHFPYAVRIATLTLILGRSALPGSLSLFGWPLA